MSRVIGRDQLALDERVIEDEVIEYALKRYQAAKDAASEPRRELRVTREAAMIALERLELPEGRAVRVDRWRIERQEIAQRSVSFEVAARTRLRISLWDESE